LENARLTGTQGPEGKHKKKEGHDLRESMPHKIFEGIREN